METLASFFVGQPLNILLVAVPFVLAAWWPRYSATALPRARRAMTWAAAAWLAYAAWEALVQWRTPGADIRVDLLVIWPVLGLLSLYAVWRWLAMFAKTR